MGAMRSRRLLALAALLLALVAAVLLGPCSGAGASDGTGDGVASLGNPATWSGADALPSTAGPEPSNDPRRVATAPSEDATATLRVELYAAGTDTPLPGQAMEVRDIGGLWPWPLLLRVESGEDGSARIPVPEGRALMLQLQPTPLWARDFVRLMPLAPGEQRVVRVDLHPQPRYPGSLTVRRHDGGAVAGAAVLPLEDGVFTAAWTDAHGMALLGDLRDDYRAFYRVQAEGYADGFGELSPQQPHGELVLEPGATLEGRLLHADGRAAAGVVVRLRADPRRLGIAEASLELGWTAECAVDGSFRFPHLPAGPVLLLQARSGATSVTEILPPLEPGLHARQLQLRTTPVVRGQVVDTAQRPVAGVELHLEPEVKLDPSGYGSPLVGLPRRIATTGADGRFEFDASHALHAGSWRLGTAGSLDGSVRPGASYGVAYRYLPVRTTLELMPGQDALEVLLELEGGGAIHGRMVDHLGVAVTQGTVTAHPITDRSGMGRLQTAALDAEGRFVLEPLRVGETYRLNGSDPVRELWGSLDEVSVGGPEVLLQLPAPPGRLLGRVVDAEGGGVYATGFAYERSAGGRDVWALRIEPDGRFEQIVEEGQVYDLMIWTRDGRAAVRSGVAVPLGETEVAALELVPAARVRPAAGYSRSLQPRVELLLDGQSVYTGYGMRLEDEFLLPPGRLEVRCWQGELELPVQYHELVAGGTLDLPWPTAG